MPGWTTAGPTLSLCPGPRLPGRHAEDRPADAGVVAERVTAYLAGVQERLREAELSRAAETARAGGRGQGIGRAAARRLTAAWPPPSFWPWSWAARLALDRAPAAEAGAGGERASQRRTPGRDPAARAGPGAAGGRPGSVGAGAVAAEKARDLLEPGVEPALRKQVEELAAEWRSSGSRPSRGGRPTHRTLMDRLVDIRSAEADDRGGWTTDPAYADAFREAGLDVAALSAEEAAKRIQDRPPEVATILAAAVDDWAAIRRDRKKNHVGAAKLLALAAAADPDTWRLGLAVPWTCPTGRSPGGASTVWPKPRRSRRWGPSASTSWAGPSRTRATRPRPRRAAASPAAPPRRRLDQLRPGPVAGEVGPAGRGDPLLHGGPVDPPRDGPRAGPCARDTRASGTRRSRSSRT